MMLLHLLLHVLIYHLLSAKGGPRDTAKTNEEQQRLHTGKPKDTNYVVKRIEKCPDVGYYFTREPAPNSIDPGPCYLCFCHGDHTAVCWKRDNRRCNVDSFYYHGVGKRETAIALPQNKVQRNTRLRRSPSFADIFFRDASRDVFNRNTEDQQCKPYESSFSEDCPPADWCIGCTVCDCDTNGRWDCHILSFCPEKKKGKKAHGGPARTVVKKKPLPKSSPAPKMSSTNIKKTKPTIRRSSNNNKTPQPKRVVKSVTTKKNANNKKQQKKKPPLRYQRVSPKTKTTPVVIKKNIATHKPIQLKGNKKQKVIKKHDNNTVVLAQQVVKRVMDAVKQMVHKEMRNVTRLVSGGRSEMNNTKNNKNAPKRGEKRMGNRHGRIKRNAEMNTSAPSSTTIFTTVKEENINNSFIITSEVPSITPITSNTLNTDLESSTSSPAYTTPSDNEYYKYLIGSDNSVIPLETRQSPAFNPVTITTTVETEQKDIDRNKLKKDEINNIIEISKITDDTENKTKTNQFTINKTANDEIPMAGYDSPNKFKHVELNKKLENVNSITDVTEDNNIETTTPRFKTVAVHTVSDAPINIISYETSSYKTSDSLKYLTDYPLEPTELKIFKWQQLKKVKLPGERTRNIVKVILNQTDITEESKNKLRTKDIGRVTVAKKYNIVKILKHHRNLSLNTEMKTNTNDTAASPGKKINDVNNLLSKLLKVYNNTKATKRPKKMKKFSVIRYLKKMFYHIFRRKGTSGRYSRNHIIETLCEHFGPCVGRIKDKALLRAKLAEMDHETMSILKTVKIIKGLLRLLNVPAHANDTSHSQTDLRKDIIKLNSILKDETINDSKQPLTQTQLKQMEYVKRNTQDFIASVGKFTILLNQIVNILTKNDVSNTNHRKVASKYRPTRDPFQSLKHLLLRYNLVQNNFMKRMYELLNSYNENTYEKPKVTASQELNSTQQIEFLSRNIIKNLKKLKHLAQTMKHNGRTKRETKDDAIEYLLMLMEFMLKQNNPLDATPENDGIDLLIDAIRNAPDIKTVRKKVLDNTPINAINNAPLHMSGGQSQSNSEDSPSSINPSSEDAGNLKLEYSEDIVRPKADEQKDLFDLAEDDKDSFDRYQFDRRAGKTQKLATTSDKPAHYKLETDEFSSSNVNTTILSNSKIEPNFRADISNDVNSEDSIIDTDNKLNYSSGNSNIDHGKSNIINIFNNDNYDDNLETGNIEIGKSNNNVFSENTGNKNIEFDKNNNNGNIFDDNIENENMNFEKIKYNSGNIFNDNIENKEIDVRKDNNNQNVFNENTSHKNTDSLQKGKNRNIVNDNVKSGSKNIGKTVKNKKVYINTKDNSNYDLGTNNNTYNNIFFNDITENSNADDGKINNNDNVYISSAENKKGESKNSNIFNDNTETVIKNLPDNSNIYNSIPENLNNFNSLSDNTNNYNIVPENVNNYNSAPDNVNSYNSISENNNTDKSISQKNAAAVTEKNKYGKDIEIKKFQDVYTSDLDEDVAPLTAVDIETLKTTTEFGDWVKRPKSKPIKKVDLSDSENSDKKSKLEWIVENFGRDDKVYEDEKDHEEKRDNIDHNTTKMITVMPVKTDTTSVTPMKADASNISNEVEEVEKKKVSKINAEEVMLKKQMDLLNSLDYGTERAEFDESDSKDGNTDERYSDAFAAYFV